MRTVLAVNPNTHENKEDQNTPTTPSLSLSFSSLPPCPGYFLPQCLQSIFLALCFSIWPLSGCRMFVDLSVCECIQLHPQWGDLDLYSFVEYPRVMSLAPFTVILNHNIFFVSQLYVMRILEKVEQSPGVLSCIEDTGQRLSSKSSMFLTERELGSIIMETDSLLCGGKLITFLNRQDLKNAFHVFVSLRPDYRKALGIGAN